MKFILSTRKRKKSKCESKKQGGISTFYITSLIEELQSIWNPLRFRFP